ncbi:MAG: beta family protein [Prevotella sp.]|jgi:hypothetical protein|nr:beta family protein [Prevotella sp.]MCH4183508.1 beta family protein [Prevotella sp.]MCH4213187.1 beta family protein [Prevotella sp.]
MDKYVLIVRTAEAECRAITSTSKTTLEKITPLIEITRGRKKTIKPEEGKPYSIYPFENRLNKLKKSFRGQEVIIDVTSDEALSSAETDQFFEYDKGYKKWVKFLISLKEENEFSNIIPSLLLSFDDPDFENNFILQVNSLEKISGALLYRCGIDYDDCYDDIDLIMRAKQPSTKLYVMVDCEYVPQAMLSNVSEKAQARISNLRKAYGSGIDIIIVGTSFPNNVTEIGDTDRDVFKISETFLYNDCLKIDKNIIYGDYGSINPIRNDNIVMARGWIPRIDVALSNSYFYHKRRREGKSYAETYKTVAKEVVNDPYFPRKLKCWGTDQIIISQRTPVSLIPSFWISVRMNIHIEQQLRRISSKE